MVLIGLLMGTLATPLLSNEWETTERAGILIATTCALSGSISAFLLPPRAEREMTEKPIYGLVAPLLRGDGVLSLLVSSFFAQLAIGSILSPLPLLLRHQEPHPTHLLLPGFKHEDRGWVWHSEVYNVTLGPAMLAGLTQALFHLGTVLSARGWISMSQKNTPAMAWRCSVLGTAAALALIAAIPGGEFPWMFLAGLASGGVHAMPTVILEEIASSAIGKNKERRTGSLRALLTMTQIAAWGTQGACFGYGLSIVETGVLDRYAGYGASRTLKQAIGSIAYGVPILLLLLSEMTLRVPKPMTQKQKKKLEAEFKEATNKAKDSKIKKEAKKKTEQEMDEEGEKALDDTTSIASTSAAHGTEWHEEEQEREADSASTGGVIDQDQDQADGSMMVEDTSEMTGLRQRNSKKKSKKKNKR